MSDSVIQVEQDVRTALSNLCIEVLRDQAYRQKLEKELKEERAKVNEAKIGLKKIIKGIDDKFFGIPWDNTDAC